MALEVIRRFPVTTVVHNAGAIREEPLEELTPEDLAALSSLHLGAAIALVQAALPAMKQQHFGRIVLVSTRAVLGLAKRTVLFRDQGGAARIRHGATVNSSAAARPSAASSIRRQALD